MMPWHVKKASKLYWHHTLRALYRTAGYLQMRTGGSL